MATGGKDKRRIGGGEKGRRKQRKSEAAAKVD